MLKAVHQQQLTARASGVYCRRCRPLTNRFETAYAVARQHDKTVVFGHRFIWLYYRGA